MWYLGTGSGTRLSSCDKTLLEELGLCLAQAGWSLRTGGRGEVDDALMHGASLCASQPYEVLLPISHYRHLKSDGGRVKDFASLPREVRSRALRLAELYQKAHPNPSPLHRGLLGTHACLALGAELAMPVRFAITWSIPARADHAIDAHMHTQEAGLFELLEDRNIPLFNMAIPDHRARIETFVSNKKRA